MDKDKVTSMLREFITDPLVWSRDEIERLEGSISIFCDTVEGYTGIYPEIPTNENKSSEEVIFDYVVKLLKEEGCIE